MEFELLKKQVKRNKVEHKVKDENIIKQELKELIDKMKMISPEFDKCITKQVKELEKSIKDNEKFIFEFKYEINNKSENDLLIISMISCFINLLNNIQIEN